MKLLSDPDKSSAIVVVIIFERTSFTLDACSVEVSSSACVRMRNVRGTFQLFEGGATGSALPVSTITQGSLTFGSSVVSASVSLPLIPG